MSKPHQNQPAAAELDPQLLEAVRQEVRVQVAGLLEQFAARLRDPEGGLVRTAPGARPAGTVAPAPGAQKVVVIAAAAAAAATVLGRAVRVKRITFLNQNTISAWAEAGRLTIHNSHRIGRSL
jgi:hypothetical protein